MRTTFASRLAVAAVVAAVSSGSAHAYADAARTPLWEMTQAASAIAVVKIAGMSVPSDDGVRVARADLVESWKGGVPATVLFPRDPSWTDVQSRFPKSSFVEDKTHPTAIVFFNGPVKGGSIAQVANWGIIEVPTSDLDAFRRCLTSAVTLQRGKPTLPEQDEWFASCVARRATRGHALVRMMPQEIWLHHPPPKESTSSLSAKQRKIVIEGFIREPTNDDTFPQVLALVEREPSAEFDQVALDVMEDVLAPKPFPDSKLPPEMRELMGEGNPYYWAGAAYALLIARLGIDADARLRDWPRNTASLFPTATQLRDDWKRFKVGKKITTKPLPSLGPSHVDPSWIRLRK